MCLTICPTFYVKTSDIRRETSDMSGKKGFFIFTDIDRIVGILVFHTVTQSLIPVRKVSNFWSAVRLVVYTEMPLSLFFLGFPTLSNFSLK